MNLVTTEVLLIDDNPEETQVITEIFEKMSKPGNVNVTSVKNSEDAQEYIHKEGEYRNRRTPSLIILDLNTPNKNHEVLKDIKTDDILKCIPIVILTGFSQSENVLGCYDDHVNAYVIKPANFDEFSKYIHTFKDFWCDSVKLPKL